VEHPQLVNTQVVTIWDYLVEEVVVAELVVQVQTATVAQELLLVVMVVMAALDQVLHSLQLLVFQLMELVVEEPRLVLQTQQAKVEQLAAVMAAMEHFKLEKYLLQQREQIILDQVEAVVITTHGPRAEKALL
jgi:hypothetical protein